MWINNTAVVDSIGNVYIAGRIVFFYVLIASLLPCSFYMMSISRFLKMFTYLIKSVMFAVISFVAALGFILYGGR